MTPILDASIVIPTFRERDNLQLLLPTLFDVLRRAALVAEVIVVDDDSRDGTDELCGTLAAKNSVRLITRRGERGLATAVLHGLREASGEICVVMDADHSHPPHAVPQLVEAARSTTCDVAIGSRYVDGSAVDPNWSRFRRLNSSIASRLARGLTDASDPMAGFFAIKRTTISAAKTLRPLGYKILLELLVRCDCRRIVEIPIAFQDRARGESKLSLMQQGLYLRHLARLYTARLLGPWPTRIRPSRDQQPPAAPKRRAA